MLTRAIIIKKQNTNEYDQWITCYTEEFGKLRTIAKSILKPSSIQAMHLDVFNLVDFELINGRGMSIITGAQAISSFPGVKNSLAKTAMAYFFAEAIDKLTPEYQKDGALWKFLSSLYCELNELTGQKWDDIELADIVPIFSVEDGVKNRGSAIRSERIRASHSIWRGVLADKQVELLKILGYAPHLKECVFCAEKISAFLASYNTQAGGMVCKDCFLNGRGGIVIKNGEWKDINVLGSIFENLAEKNFYSLNFLKTVIK